MPTLGYILFLCVQIGVIATLNLRSHGSKIRMKRFSNNSEDLSSLGLHSYMKQLYDTRAQGNGNGSFYTISLGDQKILATSIRGFGTEKSGTTWEGSTIEMQFRLGNAFKQDNIVVAELVVISKQARLAMSQRFNVSVYFGEAILAPNGTRLLDSHVFPRTPNVKVGLNVTRAVKAWSQTAEKTYKLQLKLEDLVHGNGTKLSVLNVWRSIKHGHTHGPFLVLYTTTKHQNNKDDIWELVTVNWLALLSKPDNTTVQKNKHITEERIIGESTGRVPRHPSLTCYKVSFAIKMRDFYSNIIMPHIGYINYCDGYCYFPIQNHLSPTTHAVIWAMWWKRNSPDSNTPKRPHCVPTKLGSLTVMLSDPETGHPVQKEWQDFSAKECGCR